MVRGDPSSTPATTCVVRGNRFRSPALPGRLDQRAAAYFIDPNFRWSKWGSTASLLVERDEENPVYSSQIESASYQVQRFLDKKKADVFFLRYSFSQTDLTRILIPELVLTQDQHVRLSTSRPISPTIPATTLWTRIRVLCKRSSSTSMRAKLGSSANFAKAYHAGSLLPHGLSQYRVGK